MKKSGRTEKNEPKNHGKVREFQENCIYSWKIQKISKKVE
jgi:hypothetical protein